MNKVQYSKVWPLITTVVFIFVLIFCATRDADNIHDASLYVGMLSATGAVELTTIVYYMKNSWMEKVAAIKAGTIKTASQERLAYNKEMLMFLKENGLTREDLDLVEMDSPLDELDNEALESLNSSVNNAMDEASATPEAQSV